MFFFTQAVAYSFSTSESAANLSSAITQAIFGKGP
jgi:hypothetical protein